MKRLASLKVILVYLAYQYTMNQENYTPTEYFDLMNNHPDHKWPEAMLIWFGTINPSPTQINLFIKVWWDTVTTDIFSHIPDIILGHIDLTEIITETIL